MKTKAFGKVLVFGGYAILEEGNVGLVVNVDKGTTCTVEENAQLGVQVSIPQYGLKSSGKIEEGKLVLDSGDVRLSFLVNAVTYAIQYLGTQDIKPKDMIIETENDDALGTEVKTGLGSSASATVSIVASVLGFHGVDDRDAVYKISCYSHHLTQDRFGSNYDIFAACYGSHFFTGSKMKLDDQFMRCMSVEWNISRDHFTWPKDMIPVLIFTGRSASTKRMVEQVLGFRKKEPKRYAAFLKGYDDINQELRKRFENGDDVIGLLEKSWSKRKGLGELTGAKIEPEEFTDLISSMKKQGALTAGLVGAGGGDSILALCNDETDRKKLIAFVKKEGYDVFETLNVVDSGYVVI